MSDDTHGNAPRIASATVVFEQDSDCHESAGAGQFIEVETHDEGGIFLTIKTERWAIDPSEIDAFAAMLRRVAGIVGGESADDDEPSGGR